MRPFSLILVVLLLGTCEASGRERPPRRIVRVSIIGLIGSPGRYDGTMVQTEGFVSLDFEGVAVFLSKSDYDFHLYANAVYLSLTEAERNAFKSADGNYCWVEGVFTQRGGHGGLFAGEIVRIRSIRPVIQTRH
jgi:hypothetical protein